MKDVARQAGVSTATVSRVLNDQPNVKLEVRAKVLEAIEALKYRPSRVARRLRTNSTHVIGLIISDIQNLFFTSVTRGIEDVASRNGYSLILCNTDEDLDRERVYLEVMHDENVAGIILASASETGHDPELYNSHIPIVALDRLIKDVPLDTVLVDNVGGAKTAVTHLLSIGHRRIGLITGPQHLTTGRERQEGYEQALKEFGLAIDPALIRRADFRQVAESRQQALELLTLPQRPTALFTANTMITLGALTAIQELGLRIPDDIAIAAFDDIPWATLLNPPLTAVPQPTYALGKTAGEMLLARIADPDRPPAQIRLELQLVVRESCGAHRRMNMAAGASQ
jgi:DNA-binding LacI/PurR family transcriptional regulator